MRTAPTDTEARQSGIAFMRALASKAALQLRVLDLSFTHLGSEAMGVLATAIASQSLRTATSLVQAALLYLIITVPLTRLVAWLETRQRRAR